MNNYYVATEDGMHFDIFANELSIFDALCTFHDAINDGDEGRWEEIELGTVDDDNIEPLLYYSF